MASEIKVTLRNTLKSLSPFKDILWFLFLFIGFDLLYKLFVSEGDTGSSFIFLGRDLTREVYPICEIVAKSVYWMVHDLFGYETFSREGIIIYFPDALRLRIVWGCTSLKQIFIFALILMCYYGPWRKKLYYVPLAIIVLWGINILRISVTAILTKNGFPTEFIAFNEWYNQRVWSDTPQMHRVFRKDWFQLFHKDVFRWLYYDGVVFLLWLLWQEKFNLPYQKRKLKAEAEPTDPTKDLPPTDSE
ncbi:exosortase/archaeosortase family protein [Dysgonomonas sp. PH5-45]|uniref:archaeosortase/exosortase family protein n=1 Tax=unclassified Dysgonomonas TaxID=2630389 RepID=UPI0024768DD6|nr:MULTISPECIES: archaeosortase/exosortase family protein [unclassified Dysgonomonas]MDH6355272.1 exosortase/archaeosortase family protein [Dysgonomonas sp. PH5-45]MDH6388202.1 exosortase/archaeosortase family protein [Dysgonomonas sp. PH5-37]